MATAPTQTPDAKQGNAFVRRLPLIIIAVVAVLGAGAGGQAALLVWMLVDWHLHYLLRHALARRVASSCA